MAMKDIREDLYDLGWGEEDPPARPSRPYTPVDRPLPGDSPHLVAGIVALLLVLLALLAALLVGGASGAASERRIAEHALREAAYAADSTERALDHARSMEASLAAAYERIAALEGELAAATKAAQARVSPSRAATPRPKRTAKRTSYDTAGVEQWRTLVARYFKPGYVDAALSVMRKESSGRPDATDKEGCAGLFQIHPCHSKTFNTVTGKTDLYDPEANIRFAAYLSKGGADWGAWSVKP